MNELLNGEPATNIHKRFGNLSAESGNTIHIYFENEVLLGVNDVPT
jgi:hypothetical protein